MQAGSMSLPSSPVGTRSGRLRRFLRGTVYAVEGSLLLDIETIHIINMDYRSPIRRLSVILTDGHGSI